MNWFRHGFEYLIKKFSDQQTEIGELKRLVLAMADRIHKQSELLSKKAEKK